MKLSEAEYQSILSRPAIAKRNPSGDTGVCAAVEKPVKGKPLERIAPRKSKSGDSSVGRFAICFIVYAVRPCDYDGYHIKELQDLLVHAGILPDDNWRVLEGKVISQKAHSPEEERTEVFIERAAPFTYGGKTIIADELI